MKPLLFILLFQIVSFASGDNSKLFLPDLPKCEKISEIEKMIPFEYRELIITQCNKYNIPLEVLVKHLKRESKFNPTAINYNYKKDKTGKKYLASIDEGIGQQNSLFHEEAVRLDNNGKEFNPMNPYEAIPVIAHHLYRLQKITNDWPTTIAGYNCGLTRTLSGDIPRITINHLTYVFGPGHKYDKTSSI